MRGQAAATFDRAPRRRTSARIDALITPGRLVVYPWALVLFWVMGLALAWRTQPGWIPLPDFAARWTAGRMLLDGQSASLYDVSAQSTVQARELGATQLSWFVSPPFVAVLFAPLAALPYPAACALWFGVSTAALVTSVRLLRPEAQPAVRRTWSTALLLVLASAPLLELVGSGQDTGLVLLAVVIGVLLLRSRHEFSAGLCLSLGLIKPHLIVLVPLVLIFGRQLLALAGFALGALVALAISIAAVGVSGIAAWLAVPFSGLYATSVTSGQAWKSVSLPSLIHLLAPPGSTWTGPLTLALAAAAMTGSLWLLSRRGFTASDWKVWGAVLLTTAVWSPHFMLYDAVLLIPALVTLSRWDAVSRSLIAVTYILLWLLSPVHAVSAALAWPATLVALPWAALGIAGLWATSLRTT